MTAREAVVKLHGVGSQLQQLYDQGCITSLEEAKGISFAACVLAVIEVGGHISKEEMEKMAALWD